MISNLKITLDPWSILLLFSALLGIFLSIIFLLKRSDNKKVIYLLASLDIVIVLLIVEYLLFNTGVYKSAHIPIFLLTPLVFLIGPLYYFYSVALLDRKNRLKLLHLLHLIPFILCVINYTDYYETILKHLLAKQNGEFDFIINLNGYHYMLLEILQASIYVFWVYRLIKNFEINVRNQLSGIAVLKIVLLKRLNIAFLIYLLLKFGVFLFFIEIRYSINVEYFLALALSLIIYVIGYSSINLPEIFSSQIKSLDFPKYQKSILSQEQIQVLKEKLFKAMEYENIYLKADLNLNELANSIGVSTNHLSQLLNQELNTNFYDFINAYRVKEAKVRLSNPNFKNQTILAIAHDSGFSSKTSFNRIFKKHTGVTPSFFTKSSFPNHSH
jgi:AraC-like DNA-binding protein